MNIITISREFGSGGREIGVRLSQLLGWDYYDREIIAGIAREEGLDEEYVDRVLEQRPRQSITLRKSFATLPRQSTSATLLGREKRIIERIAAKKENCVLVGRNADVYLREEEPFSIFVCASMQAKILRCRQRAQPTENFTDRELERRIRSIDKNRSALRELVGGDGWGKPSSYRLVVNTTGWEIKELTPALALMARNWFERGREE